MKQYLNLLNSVKDKGTLKPAARENMPGTTSLFGHQIRHDLQTGFPLLTTKKLSFKNITVELLWFLRGDTNVKYLIDNGCNIWNEDAYNYYKKVTRDKEFVTFERFIEDIKSNPLSHLKHIKYPNYTLGDCGYQYGKLWRDWDGKDQISDIINGLKSSPMSRRHVLTAWNPTTLDEMALNACHALVQFNCRPLTLSEREDLYHKTGNHYDKEGIPKYYLDCQMYQRSADVFLGVPYNIASYALLTHIFAKICNMIPGDYVHSFGDVHIYDNHMDQVNEQLNREPKKLPILRVNDEFWLTESGECGVGKLISNIDALIKSFEIDDFQVENYNPDTRIKAKLSTGLK